MIVDVNNKFLKLKKGYLITFICSITLAVAVFLTCLLLYSLNKDNESISRVLGLVMTGSILLPVFGLTLCLLSRKNLRLEEKKIDNNLIQVLCGLNIVTLYINGVERGKAGVSTFQPAFINTTLEDKELSIGSHGGNVTITYDGEVI